MKTTASFVITFRVDESLARAIRQAAREDGRLVSSFLRRLVERALKQLSSQPEA